ncbi:MAG: DUF4465 domain-containing protein [Akkermansiaceae bacterium]|nr:DUF4465 domain-containing protein [Akkermansiaceae bacterium]MCF7733902.1 DUF4465 domain-containing protein [Akkermansiaceae bacterium]
MKQHLAGTAAVIAAITTLTQAATTITYEEAVLGPEGYLNDMPYATAGVTHSNNLTPWGSWEGFAVTNHTANGTLDWTNQYSSYPGSGAGASAQYAVGYVSSAASTRLTFNSTVDFAGKGAAFANTAYAALTMQRGYFGAKQFGGTSGTDPDFLRLTISGYANSVPTGTPIEFLLADYRSDNSAEDYILGGWQQVDFTPLGSADEIRFAIDGSDNDPIYGLNTPAYFAMDNLVVPEPSALALLLAAGLTSLRRKRTT